MRVPLHDKVVSGVSGNLAVADEAFSRYQVWGLGTSKERRGERILSTWHGHLLPVATRTCKQIALLLNISCLRTIISER